MQQNSAKSFLEENYLAWYPEAGVGYYPVKELPYDVEYFNKYVEYSKTELGKALSETRRDLVDGTYLGSLLDVGIGCGDFIKTRGGSTYGYDINPVSVDWLIEKSLFLNPYYSKVYAASFWDALEHIHDIDKILKNVKQYVFCSIPIFKNLEHLLASKHYRKDEHCWYFTHEGLKFFMKKCGFEMIHCDDRESKLGREDILSYIFSRCDYNV